MKLLAVAVFTLAAAVVAVAVVLVLNHRHHRLPACDAFYGRTTNCRQVSPFSTG